MGIEIGSEPPAKLTRTVCYTPVFSGTLSSLVNGLSSTFASGAPKHGTKQVIRTELARNSEAEV